MKLEDLSLALRQGAQGEANLAGLNDQYQRATDLYNTQTARPDKFGRTSGLAVLNDLVGGIRGDSKMRALEPQREAARAAVAENKFALPLYQAKAAQDAAAQQQQNFETTREDKAAAATALALAKQAEETKKQAKYEAEQLQTATAPTEYVNSDGNRILLSRRKDGKWIDGRGEVLDSIEGLSEVPKATINTDGSAYKDKGANKRAEEAINSLGAADRVIGLYNDLSPETIARISSPTKRIGNIAVKAILPKDVSAFVKSEIEKDPQVKQYYSALSQMSAKERHAMFGGALTQFEAMSSDDFLAFVIGMTPEEQISRVANSVAQNEQALRSGDAINGEGRNNYLDAYKGMNFSNINGLIKPEPQEGSVNAPTTPAIAPFEGDEEAAYQEWKLEQGIK